MGGDINITLSRSSPYSYRWPLLPAMTLVSSLLSLVMRARCFSANFSNMERFSVRLSSGFIVHVALGATGTAIGFFVRSFLGLGIVLGLTAHALCGVPALNFEEFRANEIIINLGFGLLDWIGISCCRVHIDLLERGWWLRIHWAGLGRGPCVVLESRVIQVVNGRVV